MLSLGTDHIVLSHGCIDTLDNPLSGFIFTCNPVRAAAKMSAGGVDNPYNQLTAVSYQSSSTNYSSEGI